MEDEKSTDLVLTKKQELFCKYYVSNGHNGTQAAIQAGYSENTAGVQANENLKKPNIIEMIKQLEAPIVKKLGLDENWVLTKLKNFAEADITDFFEIKDNKITLKDFNLIPKEKTMAIESIKQTRNGIEIKLIDKKSSSVDVGKHIGMFKEQIEITERHLLLDV